MKVLVLCGGDSSEHQISINSARNIIKYLDNYDVWCIKNHKFYKTCGILDKDDLENSIVVENINEVYNYDLVFPVLHGKYGEDGCIQGFLETLDIPYVGCGVLSSSTGMDKGIFKTIMDGLDIPVVPYKIYTEYPKDVKDFPVMVKPCNGGSSIGISKINNIDELKKACDLAFKYDKRIIVEKWIDARELECAVLENEEDIIVSSIGEVKSAGFYDYESKYQKETELIIPANITLDQIAMIKKYAYQIFTFLDCHSLARIDFFLADKIYINEINTLPGFNDISMFSKLLNYDGYDNQKIISILTKKKHSS